MGDTQERDLVAQVQRRADMIADAHARKSGKKVERPFTLEDFAIAEISRLRSELEATRAALKPFADVANTYTVQTSEGGVLTLSNGLRMSGVPADAFLQAHKIFTALPLAEAPKSEPNLAPSNVYPAVPDGWQLVPKEPTREMCMAGYAENTDCDREDEIYRAMLAAAPAPESAE
jgi:hypothetical protein